MPNSQIFDPKLLTDENPTKIMVPRSTGRIDGFRFPGSKIIPIGWPRKIRWLDRDITTFVPKDSFQVTAYLLADRCILALYEVQLAKHLKLRMKGRPGLVLCYGDIAEKFRSKNPVDFHNEFETDSLEMKMEKCLYAIGQAAFEYSRSKWRPSRKHSSWETLSYATSLWGRILEALKSVQNGAKGGASSCYRDCESFKSAYREERDHHAEPVRQHIVDMLKPRFGPESRLYSWATEADEEDGIKPRRGRPKKRVSGTRC